MIVLPYRIFNRALIGNLEDARDTAANTLLGPQMATEDLEAWLNDPDYGFDL